MDKMMSGSSSNAGVGATDDAMGDAIEQTTEMATRGFTSGQGMRGVAGMGLIGGGVSAMTGGDFSEGAMFGVGAGLGARTFVTSANLQGAGQKILNSNSKFAKNGFVKDFGTALSEATVSARQSALAGAGLGGFIFGGSGQPSHSRGFNQHRGNGF